MRMRQLRMLGSCAAVNCLRTTKLGSSVTVRQLQYKRRYATEATTATIATTTQAKPFHEMPTINKLKLVLGFMPGGKYANKDLNDIMKSILEESGGDIVKVPGLFGKLSLIFTQNPDDFETVFRHDGAWPNRKGFEILNYYRNVYRRDYFGEETGLLTAQHEAWGKIRSAANPIIMQPKNVKLYLSALDRINQQFIERIKIIRDVDTLEMPKNFKDEISAWTLESVGVVALDRQLGLIENTNPADRHFFTLLQDFFDLAVELEVKPSLWRQFTTPKLRKALKTLDDALHIVDQYLQEAIERIEKSPNVKSDAEKSVLEKLLSINRKYAVIIALDMLFAGVDTTTSTFAAILLALAQNPGKQDKLRAEIREILPERDTPLSVESMKNMPYLRACIKESLRYYPLTAANMRTTNQELVLSGYAVPRGSQIGMIHLNLWRSAKHFSQPEQFLPERWLRDKQTDKQDSSGCPAVTKPSHPFVYLPFGFGSRSCIGRRIAEMELEIGVARLLRNFYVEFNHPATKPFIAYQLATPGIPLQFKLIDVKD